MLTLINRKVEKFRPQSFDFLDYVQLPQQPLGVEEYRYFSDSKNKAFKWSYYNHILPYSETQGILFNALNASTALFNLIHKNELEIYSKSSSLFEEDFDKPRLDSLLLGHYLIPKGFDEVSLIRHRLSQGRGRTDLLHLTLAPTMGCNFNCTYCFEPEKFRKNMSIMTLEVQDAIVNLIERLLKKGEIKTVSISWFGGEPLLALNVIVALSHRIIALCEQYQCQFHGNITTNGFSLNPKAIEQLQTCRISFLKISLDGPPAVHDQRRILRNGRGTFQRILENIIAASNFFKVNIRVNVDKSNQEHLLELLETLSQAKLNHRVAVYLAIVEENEAVEGVFKTFLSRKAFAEAEHNFHVEAVKRNLSSSNLPSPRTHFCSADLTSGYMFGPNGERYACWGDFGNPAKQIGNILTGKSFNNAYHQSYTHFDPTTHPKCSSCTVLPLCLGGCSRERLYLNEPQCGVYKFNLGDRIRAYVRNRLESPA